MKPVIPLHRLKTLGDQLQNYSQTVYVYGADGEKLTVAGNAYGQAAVGTPGTPGPSGIASSNSLYWSGRLIKQNTDVAGAVDSNFVAVDRLGSVKKYLTAGGGTAYLPYGEQLVNNIAGDQMLFASYTRDSSTGLDYADQRYYSSQFGRFMSADRFRQAAKAKDSGSWNQYSYTRGDPVNRSDRRGTCDDGTERLVFGDSGCQEDCWENPEFCDFGGGGDPGAISHISTVARLPTRRVAREATILTVH